jgi:predicted enzyme related to lactoylglutathione lyase
MPSESPIMEATVSHFEIPARDLERAARFYREVFGWTVEPVAWEGHPYYKVRGSAKPAEGGGKLGIDGGLLPADPGTPHPLLVIHVSGAPLETWLDRITAAGGTLDLPAAPVGTMGAFARFRDPEGNLLGLWGPSPPGPGADGPG